MLLGVRLTEATSRRNQHARAVLLHFHAAYAQQGNLLWGIRGDAERYAELGMTAVDYKAATDRLLGKDLLTHQGGPGSFVITRLGIEVAEDPDALDDELPVRPLPVVPTPSIEGAPAIVEHALLDAELAVAERRSASAIDRLHTGLQAYARELCVRRQIEPPPDATLPRIVSLLWESVDHAGARPEAKKVLRSLGAVSEALTELRNHASPAHPNALADEADALLAVNAARTLLTYLRDRFDSPSRR